MRSLQLLSVLIAFAESLLKVSCEPQAFKLSFRHLSLVGKLVPTIQSIQSVGNEEKLVPKDELF